MKNAFTRAAAVAAIAAGMGVVPGQPAQAVSLEVAFASFSGDLAQDGRSGSTTFCLEVVTNARLLTCSVSFSLRTSICNVDLGERAGFADYNSPRPDFSIQDIPLYGAYAGGQGVLQSGPIIKIIGGTAYVLEMTIDAHQVCLEDPLGKRFVGKVTYL